MAFVTGTLLIDAPASALNNLGSIPGARTDNTVGVKVIRTLDGVYPYVSAQAFRYWLRSTLDSGGWGWTSAPVYREEKVAYTDANPIKWWDDDLFGYMRAPSKRTSAKEKREADESRIDETPTTDTITRSSPFRVGTLVSIAPASPTADFGTMSRHEGDPVPHEHQFYRTTLQGLFSLDLHAAGRFSYRKKTGFRHLDDVRIAEAQSAGLTHSEEEKEYVLPLADRVRRVAALFEGIAHLEGGAKQALHYTDVAPALSILAITKGGNHIFGHIIGADRKGQPQLKIEALLEALEVHADDLLSDVYVGWVRGYLDEERARFEGALTKDGVLAAYAPNDDRKGPVIRISHPRDAFKAFVADLTKAENEHWLA